jgi:hypothetical protein
MVAEDRSAITDIRIQVDRSGLGRYVALYSNGEPGPVSEGYGRRDQSEAQAMRLAEEAAHRDFPDIDDAHFHFDVDPA